MSSTRQQSPVRAASSETGTAPRHAVTTPFLIRASAAAAMAAGVLFIGVQIGHPQLTTTSIGTTNVLVRDTLKVLMCALAVVGITGMYLSQIRRNGVLGLIGYVVMSAGYLLIMCTTFLTTYVLPTIADSNPRYVKDIIAVGTQRGTVIGDIGALGTMWKLQGVCYLLGGLLFGIALYRAGVLARWAAALLALGGVVSIALSLMPDAFYRLLAVPNGIAMIGLGYSLWTTRTATSTDSVSEPAAATAAATG